MLTKLHWEKIKKKSHLENQPTFLVDHLHQFLVIVCCVVQYPTMEEDGQLTELISERLDSGHQPQCHAYMYIATRSYLTCCYMVHTCMHVMMG